MTTTLNGPLLRQRRIEASLGLHHAAHLLDVGTPTLSRIESGDTNAASTITLPALLRLASALGCSPADLFTDNNPAPAPEGAAQVDPQLLLGVLQQSPTQVSIKDLANTFNATNADVRAAAQNAKRVLAGTGLRLGQRDDMYFLAPEQQAAVTRLATSLERTSVGRFGIDNGYARILKQVLAGRLTTGRKSIYTQSVLAALTRLGIVNATSAGHTPSDALRYALDVP